MQYIENDSDFYKHTYGDREYMKMRGVVTFDNI